MVTSSAVVGSSAIMIFGLQASAMAIMTRWRIPPESSMRIHLIDALTVGNADGLEHLDGALFDVLLGLALALVQGDDLVDLRADAEDGVQAGHRLLEDHRDDSCRAAPASSRLGSWRCRTPCRRQVQADLALDDLALRALQQLHQGQAGNGLTAAGLAHDADRLADGHLEGDAVNAFDHAGIGEEVGVQVIELDRVFLIVHLDRVLALRHVAALAFFLVLIGNAAVFFGDTPRLFGGKVSVLFFSHRVFLLPISVSSWGQRRRADRHPQS